MIFTTFKKKRQKDFHKTFSLAVIEIVEISSVNIRVFLYETKYFNHRLIIKEKRVARTQFAFKKKKKKAKLHTQKEKIYIYFPSVRIVDARGKFHNPIDMQPSMS